MCPPSKCITGVIQFKEINKGLRPVDCKALSKEAHKGSRSLP